MTWIRETTIISNQGICSALPKGYLRAGAFICGEPAWDPDFRCADFFVLLPLAATDARYARRFVAPAGQPRA